MDLNTSREFNRREVFVPQDQAPSLAPWGGLSRRVAQIIRVVPDLAGKLLCAPRSAFHASALYLLCNPNKSNQDAGADLLHLSPAQMVDCCLSSPASRFMGALKKCGPEVYYRDFYIDLNDMLSSPLAEELIIESSLTPEVLLFFQELQRLDPLVLPARIVLEGDVGSAKQLDAMIKFCRRLGVLRDDVSESKEIRVAASHSIEKYFSKRMERCISPHNFLLPVPLRQIRTAAELTAIALSYRNCLGRIDYKVQLGLGSHIYIIAGEPLNCLIELRHEHEEVWSIVECEHFQPPKRVKREVRQHICHLLFEAGIHAQPASFDEIWLDIEPIRSLQRHSQQSAVEEIFV